MLTKLQRDVHRELGIPDDYASTCGLPYCEEATELVEVGQNLVGRMQHLAPAAGKRWRQMVLTAHAEDVQLMIVSGYRGFDYQAGLIRSKLEKGQVIEEILKVNAAPGYSEHHTGRAVDVATPGSRPLTEEFETSEAFRWLKENAAQFGFGMSYPADNPWGITYEPWHWALTSGAKADAG